MLIQDARFVVLDTETTGLDPGEDRVVELSLVEVSKHGIRPMFDSLLDPKRPIPPTASAVHHITDRHVQGQPTLAEVWPTILDRLGDSVIVAHNAAFDRSFLPETHRPWLCSMRLARHLWPEAPKYSNQVLRYWLGLELDAGQAHSATADTLVTAHVFRSELGEYQRNIAPLGTVEDLLAYAESPIEVQTMPFGKYKGQAMAELPESYVRWLLENVAELDPDLRWTLEKRAVTSV